MTSFDSERLPPLIRGLRVIVVLAGATISALSLLGFLGQFHWVLDLCSHFRIQYVIALLLVCALLLMLRCRKTAFGFLLFAGLNGALVLPLFLGGQQPKPTGLPTLRVMLLNVNTNTGDPVLVKKAIQEADPDILVLEEISARWLEDLSWIKTSHPYSIAQPREDNFGIGLFSKQPLIEGKIEYIGMNIPSIRASIHTSGNSLRIVATHPTPPTSRDYSRWRDKQLDQLPRILGSPWPLLLVGDLNVTPWSSHFRRLTQRTGLLDSSKGRGFHPTWPNNNWFLRIPIDHVLHTPDISVVERRVGGDVASDHFPVIVDILVPPAATTHPVPVHGPG